MENVDDLGESVLGDGNKVAIELAAAMERVHSASAGIAKSLFTQKIRAAELDLQRITSAFLDYERSASLVLQRLVEYPKLLTPDRTVYVDALISRLAAQRDTNRALLQTVSAAVSNLRQRADARIANGVNAALLALTLGSIGLALASYRTATTTLNDARESAKRQEEATGRQIEALDAANRALNSVSSATVSQQELLKKTADSAGRQVALLSAQQARDLEEADISAVMYYPADPSLLIINNGPHRVAKDVFYEVRLLNLSAANGDGYGLLGTGAPKVEYILPHNGVGPAMLTFHPSGVDRQPKEGDSLFGYATIQCPVCTKRRVYWMYIEYGKWGVFAEGNDRDFPFIGLNNKNASATVEKFLQLKSLIRMPTRLE